MKDFSNVEFSYLDQFCQNDGLATYEALKVHKKFIKDEQIILHLKAFSERFLDQMDSSEVHQHCLNSSR